MKGLLRPGLYANIHAKRKRIKDQKARGETPERMRKPGSNCLLYTSPSPRD